MPNRPNALFPFTNDHRVDTVRSLGNEDIRTPAQRSGADAMPAPINAFAITKS